MLGNDNEVVINDLLHLELAHKVLNNSRFFINLEIVVGHCNS